MKQLKCPKCGKESNINSFGCKDCNIPIEFFDGYHAEIKHTSKHTKNSSDNWSSVEVKNDEPEQLSVLLTLPIILTFLLSIMLSPLGLVLYIIRLIVVLGGEKQIEHKKRKIVLSALCGPLAIICPLICIAAIGLFISIDQKHDNNREIYANRKAAVTSEKSEEKISSSIIDEIIVSETLSSSKPVTIETTASAKPVTTKPSPSAKPVTAKPSPSPKPVTAKPSPSPKPVTAKPSPSPKPVTAKPSPSPKPVTTKPSPSPKPVTPKPSPSPKPVTVKPSPSPSVKPITLSAAEMESNYMSKCQHAYYDTIARDPNGKKGEFFKFTGEIKQVGKNDSFYHLEVEKDQWGIGKRIEFHYNGEKLKTRILEGDEVTVWGESEGLIDYKTVLGDTRTIPSLSVKYIYNMSTNNYSADYNNSSSNNNASNNSSDGVYNTEMYGEVTDFLNPGVEHIYAYTTESVFGDGIPEARWEVETGWHITIKRRYDKGKRVWFECWDTDDGDYYGWIDSEYVNLLKY